MERKKIPCNRCLAETFHQELFEKVLWGWHVPPEEGTVDHPDEADWSDEFGVFQCLGCDDICLRLVQHDRDASPGFTIRYFPPRLLRRVPVAVSSFPQKIADTIREVYSALASGGTRLSVMGARAVLDMVLTDKVGDAGGFSEKLTLLREQGFVGRVNEEQLRAVLEVGHAAAHRGHAPSVEDVEQVMDILENLLHSVYVHNSGANRLRGSTPRRYPKGI